MVDESNKSDSKRAVSAFEVQPRLMAGEVELRPSMPSGCSALSSDPEKRMLQLLELGNRADDGDADAQFELGQRYFYGYGVVVDHLEAATWYRRAVENGHSRARSHIASGCLTTFF